MKVITFVTQKGGAGKTTCLINLAVEAAKAKNRVLIIDVDPQKSTEFWWEQRQNDDIDLVENINASQLDNVIDEARQSDAYDYVFIDTSGIADLKGAASIRVADLCIVPSKPSLVDIKAAAPTIEIIKTLEKKSIFLITQMNPRKFRLTDTMNALAVYGFPICPQATAEREPYKDAYALGYGVQELDAKSKGAYEIRAIWQWVEAQTQKSKIRRAA